MLLGCAFVLPAATPATDPATRAMVTHGDTVVAAAAATGLSAVPAALHHVLTHMHAAELGHGLLTCVF